MLSLPQMMAFSSVARSKLVDLPSVARESQTVLESSSMKLLVMMTLWFAFPYHESLSLSVVRMWDSLVP